MTKRKTQLEKLEELAEEIGAAGATDDLHQSEMAKAVREGLKGVGDAFTHAIGMLKAKPKSKSKDDDDVDINVNVGDDDDDDTENDDTGDGDEPPAEDPDAGYTDMRMGQQSDDEIVDVEPLLRDIHSHLRAATKDRNRYKKLLDQQVAMTKAVEAQNVLLRTILETQLNTTGPMMKAIAGIGTTLAQTPAPALIGRPVPAMGSGTGPFGGQRPARTGKLAGLDDLALKRVMVKAHHKRVLSELEIQRFQASGRFADDEATNKQIADAVEALV